MNGVPRPRRNADLRQHNSIDVLRVLRTRGRLSRSALSAYTTLSNPALASILQGLVENGYVLEVATRGAARGRGRPAMLYEYNPHRFSVIALYIGLRYAELAICDGLGRRTAESVEFNPGWDIGEIAGQSERLVRRLKERAGVEHLPSHAGVVVHGLVDPRTGAVDSPEMDWHKVPLADALRGRLGDEISVYDASRAAAIAECREGRAVDARRAIILNAGPEIIATQVLDGVPDVGASGLAGMIGRARLHANQTFASIDDLVGSFAVKRRYTNLSGKQVNWMTDVIVSARAGDPNAETVMLEYIDTLAYACMWLITIGNPELLVITGTAGDYAERWKARIHSTIVELTDPHLLECCSIQFTDLGRQAWIRGGVHAVLDHVSTLEGAVVPLSM